jgi:putative polyketide hydroxylase
VEVVMGAQVEEVPVLVAGAGPAGLAVAAVLGRYGIETLLVERRHRPSELPRATAISTRSMELLRSLGLEHEVRAGGVDVEWLGWSCETLADVEAGAPMPLGLPTREQAALISPTGPACVPQDHLEPVLLRHLRSSATVRVLTGAEVVLATNGPDGVVAELRDAAGGDSRIVEARYLVAADGVRSAIRAALEIPMRGPAHLATAVSALFHAPLWRLAGRHRYGLYDINRAGAEGVLLPAGPGDRWLYGAVGGPELEGLAGGGAETMARRVRQAIGAAGPEPRIERLGAFSFGAQVAERFREGSAFLVGDAAHRVTPRGGTGMNTAIHDGWDLGWRLAWVLQGWAGPALLDSYETERRPVAEHNTDRSADSAAAAEGVEAALSADLGGRIRHLWLPTAAGRVSTLDLIGPGLTLLTGPDRGGWEAVAHALACPAPVAVRSMDPISARALGIDGSGALMARPDGVPVALWPSPDRAPADSPVAAVA